MKRNWHLALLGISTAMAAGCGADMGAEMGADDEENVASAQQKEVYDCGEFTATDISSIKFNQELLITDLSVVNDTPTGGCRTSWNKGGCATGTQNVWHFWYVMQQMAGTNNVTKFVLRWLESMLQWPHPVNGQFLDPRPGIRTLVIDPWMQATNTLNGNTNCKLGKLIDDPLNASCQLDPNSAPFRLLAVVNRMDLKSNTAGPYGGGNAGEGRLVFGFYRQTSTKPAIQGTVIFEYKLPTFDPFFFTNSDAPTPLGWANLWHGLGGTTTFGAAFNNKLATITQQFVTAGSDDNGFNLGSAISQVRVNEREFDENKPEQFPAPQVDERQWSLREFKLGCHPGVPCDGNALQLVPVTVAQAPGNQHDDTAQLESFLNTNASSILDESHEVPAMISTPGGFVPFLGAESRSNQFLEGPFEWSTLNPLANPSTATDTLRLFALNTCNGCHYRETQTNNLHITSRASGAASTLSEFLSMDPNDDWGQEMPFTDSSGATVRYNEPRRRVCELLWTLDGNAGRLTEGSGRVH